MRRVLVSLAALAAFATSGCGQQGVDTVRSAQSGRPAAAPSARPPHEAAAWSVADEGRVACSTGQLRGHGTPAVLAAELDGTRATVTGIVSGSRWLPALRHPVLTLTTPTATFTEVLRPARYGPGNPPRYLPGFIGYGDRQWSTLCLARFSDGPPTAVTAAYTGGAHCCTRLHLLDASGDRSELETGNVGASLRVIDGALLLKTGDDAFSYTFADFADSCAPVQLLVPAGAALRDVTVRHPAALRSDARAAWRLAQDRRIRLGFLACWAADQDRLGSDALVWQRLAELNNAGKLVLPHDLAGPGGWNERAAFLAQLRDFLTQRGYRSE